MGENPVEKNIHEAILAIMGEVGYVQKEKSPNLTYTYASERALIAALRPAMISHRVYMSVIDYKQITREQYVTKNGSPMNLTFVTGIVRFTHVPSMTFVDVMATGEGADTGDKSANKSSTGMYKYAIRQMFMIETGDDPDTTSSETQERSGDHTGKKPADKKSQPAGNAAQNNAGTGSSAAGEKHEIDNNAPPTPEMLERWNQLVNQAKGLGIIATPLPDGILTGELITFAGVLKRQIAEKQSKK